MKKRILSAFILCLGLASASAQIGTKAEVKQEMKKVADWQVKNFDGSKYGELDWVYAPFYLGLTHWAALAEQQDRDDSYYQWLMKLGRRNGWQPAKRMYHADDIAVSQAWLQLYEKYKQKSMLNPTEARADWVVANPPTGSFELDYGKSSTLDHWTWCDALFMAPPVYVKLYNITGNKKFIRFMDKEYKATYNYLYDKKDSLFYRDWRYFNKKEENGAKVFWGRGNGWVVGGLAEILRELPQGNKYRKFYQELFVEMCTRIAKLQNKDGFWHASLLDPASYPSPETSSSSFFVYALAYGVNEGLLPRDTFMPVIAKGWAALCSAVEPDGKLGYVQPIGADPKKVTRDMTEVYGPGAFLMAGMEIYKLAK
ncbi:MAG: glycoside hydrolase family 88 protein [Mediterranea sp.]|jgi:rhamnogalacturonyl hydrolase YesR|nr:glycoside hydrolase family 88 protein [Mediterranea sp.]